MTKLYAQTTTPHVDFSTIDAVLSASIVVQLTLAVLIIFSILSWSIIFMKFKHFSQVKQTNDAFFKHFWGASSWNDISRPINYNPKKKSPSEAIFNAGFEELKHLAKLSGLKSFQEKQAFNISDIDNVQRALRKASELEISKLESNLSLLATIGSTSPFIGLFGTVWGIMNAFQKIGATGAAHLAVVAPGISEALVATAFGLLVAIPAVVAYNQFSTQCNQIEINLSHFSSDFLNIAKKNFFNRGYSTDEHDL